MFRCLAYANRPYSCLSVALTVGNLGENLRFSDYFHDVGHEKDRRLVLRLGTLPLDEFCPGADGQDFAGRADHPGAKHFPDYRRLWR